VGETEDAPFSFLKRGLSQFSMIPAWALDIEALTAQVMIEQLRNDYAKLRPRDNVLV